MKHKTLVVEQTLLPVAARNLIRIEPSQTATLWWTLIEEMVEPLVRRSKCSGPIRQGRLGFLSQSGEEEVNCYSREHQFDIRNSFAIPSIYIIMYIGCESCYVDLLHG